jgi:DNA invertase Pin-like site-specific DNA recombinase
MDAGIPPENIDPYTDTGISGMKGSRPGLDRLLSVLAPGDQIVITELSRLGRSVSNVLSLVEELDARGISMVILNLGGSEVDTHTAMGRFFIGVISVISRLERDLISERVKSTLAAKKAEGIQLGRPTAITPDQVAAAQTMRKAGMKMPQICEILNLKQSTLYRAMANAAA